MQGIDVSSWAPDPENEVYPEGAREKRALFCPEAPVDACLIPGHRYLLKFSAPRGPEQFWNEVLAFRLGRLVGVPVPPSFPAVDEQGRPGALIEWFLNRPGEGEEVYSPGGDWMQALIRDYDRKKGAQHNFHDIAVICHVLSRKEQAFRWLESWSAVLAFDALIGNTDRHQDNWGFILSRRAPLTVRLAPAFDNGTSLAYELPNETLDRYRDPDAMARYISRGRHHMRWSRRDGKRAKFAPLLESLMGTYERAREPIERVLSLGDEQISAAVTALSLYESPPGLTRVRAEFLTHLLKARRDFLRRSIGL